MFRDFLYNFNISPNHHPAAVVDVDALTWFLYSLALEIVINFV